MATLTPKSFCGSYLWLIQCMLGAQLHEVGGPCLMARGNYRAGWGPKCAWIGGLLEGSLTSGQSISVTRSRVGSQALVQLLGTASLASAGIS